MRILTAAALIGALASAAPARAQPSGDSTLVALRAAATDAGAPGDPAFSRAAHEALIHRLARLQATRADTTRLDSVRVRVDSSYSAEAFEWAERLRGGTPFTPDDCRRRLRSPREAWLVYSVGDSSSSVWVLRRRGWKHVALPPREALRPRIEELRRALSAPHGSDGPATLGAARALYLALVGPVEMELGSVDRLIVVPDDVIASVPFEALIVRIIDPDRKPPKDAWLIEHADVAYAPTIALLAREAPAARGRGGLIALGDADFELRTIAAHSDGRPFRTLRGAEATRAALLALPELADASLVHLAARAVAHAAPESAGLWLGGEGAAAFLSARDVAALKLGADLVTLSACGPPPDPRAGALTLPQAFLAAGAHRVVVSQWRADEPSTGSFMQAFYRELLEEHHDATAALAEAKRRLLGSSATRAPFHWAPFVLIGEGEAAANETGDRRSGRP